MIIFFVELLLLINILYIETYDFPCITIITILIYKLFKKKKSMQRTGLSLVIIKVRFRSWGYVKWLHKIIVTF